ncbi:hypothetical protein BJ684DRAFT_18707 [Piptocephalis cylindrospora]|uniref:DUF3835 domain-containing protein n=1 Tax=Piptocephalis cylindrospora TaxID=1907219 RepID=A0A4P9Y728_9FUNG|nr:hypothetical protein BJ684DRAFT_18707 [Piptocephalis cylindrospora]|eukprot:RKP14918.1 hypothetical protein BJ684DRAFT_18707 [Piptocephalis cylindrospora]
MSNPAHPGRLASAGPLGNSNTAPPHAPRTESTFGDGDGLDEGVVKQVLKVLDQAEASVTERLSKVQEMDTAYDALIHVLGQHETNQDRKVMVPFGPLAFMPGKLIKTNEVMAHLGDQWYTPTSPRGAIKMAKRRKEELAEIIQDQGQQIKEIQDRRSIMLFDGGLTSQKRYNEEGLEIVEIREEYHSEDEEEQKAEEVKEHEEKEKTKGKKAEEDIHSITPSAITSTTQPGIPELSEEDREILRRMEELERELEGMEEEEEEEGEYGSDEEEMSYNEEDSERQEGSGDSIKSAASSLGKRVHFGQIISGLQDDSISSSLPISPSKATVAVSNSAPPPAPREKSLKSSLKPSSPLTKEAQITSTSPPSRSQKEPTSNLVMESVMEKGLIYDPEDEVDRLEDDLHLREVEGRYQELRNSRLLQKGGVRKSILEFGETEEERQERDDVNFMYDRGTNRAPQSKNSIPSVHLGKYREDEEADTKRQQRMEKDLVRQLARTHVVEDLSTPQDVSIVNKMPSEATAEEDEGGEEEEEAEVKPRKVSRFMAARLARSGGQQ